MKTFVFLVQTIAFLAYFSHCQTVSPANKPQPKPTGEKPNPADPKANPNTKPAEDPSAATNPNSTEKIVADAAGPKQEDEEDPNLDMLKTLEIPFNVLYIMLGLPMICLGYKFLRFFMSVTGLVGGNILSLMFQSAVWDWDDGGKTQVICVLVGCFLVGVTLAVFIWFYTKFGFFFKGLITGAILGMQVYGQSIGLAGFPLKKIFMIQIVLVFAAAGTFLGVLLKANFFLGTTSYLGSFLCVRGVGTLIGNYPNVFAIKKTLPTVYYYYFMGIFGCTIIGIVAQILMRKYVVKHEGNEEAEFMKGTQVDQPDQNLEAPQNDGGKMENKEQSPEGNVNVDNVEEGGQAEVKNDAEDGEKKEEAPGEEAPAQEAPAEE